MIQMVFESQGKCDWLRGSGDGLRIQVGLQSVSVPWLPDESISDLALVP